MRRRRLVSIAALLAAAALALPLVSADATSQFTFSGTGAGRFAGANRFDTARLIAKSAGFGQVDNVVMATGRNFPDALAGNYLAGAFASPILLTERDSVPIETVTALQETVKPKTITLLGGPAAISDAVANDLRGRGYSVDRVFGNDRYQTALAVARKGQPLAGVGTIQGKKTVLLATGENYADALAAGPVSWNKHLPILLTTSNALSPEARQGISDAGAERIVILGGTAAVSSAVETSVKTSFPSATVERRFGPDRTATAAAIGTWAIENGANFDKDHVNLARGDDFADALAGGPHGGIEASPILLTASPTALDTSAGANSAFLNTYQSTLQTGHIYGGTSAVSQAVADAAAAAAGAAPPEATAGSSTPVVKKVVAGEDYFTSTADRAYYYESNDAFTLGGNTITLAQFEGVLNPDDTLSVTYSPSTTSGTSTFNVTGNVTHAPAAPAVVAGDFDGTTDTANNDVKITFGVPTNNSVSTKYLVKRYAYPLGQCGVGTPAVDTTATVTTTTGTVTELNLDNGCYQFDVTADEQPGGNINGASATSARSPDVKIPGPPAATISDARTTTPAPATGKSLAKGDVHVFYFALGQNETMASTIDDDGSRYRLSDGDGTELYVTCGSGGTTCAYQDTLEQPAPNQPPVLVHKLTVTIGTVPAPVVAGSSAGLQYPASIIEVSAQWRTSNGGGVDLVHSADTVLGQSPTD